MSSKLERELLMRPKDEKIKPATIVSITEGLSKLWDDTLVDFSIRCEGREWKIPKAILILHSPVLGAACTKDFKEANQGFIDLSEDGTECVETLVSYLYTLDYHKYESATLELHVRVCIMADKYDMKPLKLIAIDYFKKATNVACVSFPEEPFGDAIRCAYDARPATGEIRKHMIKLLTEDDVMAHAGRNTGSRFELLMREYADVATEIAVALREQCGRRMPTTLEKRFKCPGCGATFVADFTGRDNLDCSCYACSKRMMGHNWQWHVVESKLPQPIIPG